MFYIRPIESPLREGEWEQTYQLHVADWKRVTEFLIWPIKDTRTPGRKNA